ncbi:MAG TPA: hypothetical protein VIK26_05300 [Clostridium sp.]
MGDKGLLLYCITNSYDIEVTNILGLGQVNKLYYKDAIFRKTPI